jgi:AraC-like DNA-binding protein
LYYPIMNYVVSLYGAPSPAYQEIFYTVPRAGHLIAGSEHRIRRDHFPGHELVLCMKGGGYVRIRGVDHEVKAGDFFWVNCHQPHQHGGSAKSPWEVMWIRIEGPRLEKMCHILSTTSHPVFRGIDVEAAKAVYTHIFRVFADKGSEPSIHALVAQLIALAFSARGGLMQQTEVPAPLQRAIERMRLFYFQPQTVAGLAREAGMSPSHFARQFKAALGTSPIDWLRHERIQQAKRRLGDTSESIQRIAEQVGYNDRFFFSKDFKRITGFAPREFRRREQSN